MKLADIILEDVVISTMAIYGGVPNSNQSPELVSKLQNIIPELKNDFLQAIGEKSLPKLTEIFKNYLTNLFKK